MKNVSITLETWKYSINIVNMKMNIFVLIIIFRNFDC